MKSMKLSKKNLPYIVFIAAMIPLFAFFVIFPLVKAKNSKTNYSVDYDKAMTLNNYRVKISEMIYITDASELVFVYSSVSQSGADEQAKPYISVVQSHDSNGNIAEFTEPEYSYRSSVSQFVYVSDCPDDFIYIKVYVSSTISAYQEPSKTDEFGDIIEGEYHEEETKKQYAQIDKNDILFMTAQEAEQYLIPVDEDSTNDPSETDSISDDSAEFESYIDIDLSSMTDITTAADNDYSSTEDNDESISDVGTGETDSSLEELQTVSSGAAASNGGNNGGNTAANAAQTQSASTTTAVTTAEKTTASTASTAVETAKTTSRTTQKTTAKSETTTKRTTTTASQTAAKLSVSGGDITLDLGKTAMLTVNAEPHSAKTSLVWSSNRPDIAAVSDGKVTAVAAGKAIITVTDSISGLTASCMITVI